MGKTSTKLFGLMLNTTLQLDVPGNLTLIGIANILLSLQTLFWKLEKQWVSTLVSISGKIFSVLLIAAHILLTSLSGMHTTTKLLALMIGKIVGSFFKHFIYSLCS